MSSGMRSRPPPLALLAGFGDVVGVVVVAGHDRHWFGQRLQPGHQLVRVVVPQGVLRVLAQRREGERRVRGADRFAESLHALVGPDDVARAVEGEVAESLLGEVLGPHLPGQEVGPGDVGNGREARLEVLGDGDDAVAGEQLDVVRVVELPDDGVGTHLFGQVDDRLDAELVADRQRQPAEAPGLPDGVGIAGDAEQQVAGVGFREVGQKEDACHGGSGFSGIKLAFFRENSSFCAIFVFLLQLREAVGGVWNGWFCVI